MSIDKQTAERIMENAKIMDVLQWYNIPFKRSGKGYVIRCIAHDDRHPSMSVNPNDDYCKCFSCGYKAKPLKFVMDYDNKTRDEALRILADIGNIYLPSTDNGTKQKPTPFRPKPYVEPEPTYTDIGVMLASMQHYEHNPLFVFLASIFAPEKVLEAFTRYNVGTAKHILNPNQEQRRSVVFWQMDEGQRIRGGKVVAYNEQSGKRIKRSDSDTWGRDVTWVHSIRKQKDYNLKQCLFGQHLITAETKRIHVVESEKTALLASLRFGEDSGVWVATGGKDVTKSRTIILEAAKLIGSTPVTLYPDEDGVREWTQLCEELRGEGINARVTRATRHFKSGSKFDIGDWIVSEMQRRRAVEGLPNDPTGLSEPKGFQVTDNVPWEDAPRNHVQAYYSQLFPERRTESTYIPGTPNWTLYPVIDHGNALPF